MNRKAYQGTIELKADGNEGQFVATIATLNVVDRDGDVTLAGAFQEGQPVKVAAWGHRWAELPVGMGTIHADLDRAWIAGEFFLDTAGGRDTYTTVKRLGPLQEWSYGFQILDSTFGTHEGVDVRFLRKLDVFEVSPVLLGAGVGTRTDSIKSTLADQLTRVLGGVKEASDDLADVAERVAAVAALRAKEGRTHSATTRQMLRDILAAIEQFDAHRARLQEILADDPPKAADPDPFALLAGWERTRSTLIAAGIYTT